MSVIHKKAWSVCNKATRWKEISFQIFPIKSKYEDYDKKMKT